MLIGRLPPESATKTALRNAQPAGAIARGEAEADPSQAPWSQLDMLIALLIDEVRESRKTNVELKTGKRQKKVEPLARPGVVTKKRRKAPQTAEQYALLLAHIHSGD